MSWKQIVKIAAVTVGTVYLVNNVVAAKPGFFRNILK